MMLNTQLVDVTSLHTPEFVQDAHLLAEILKKKSIASLKKIMQMSDNVAEQTHSLYQNFE